MSNISIDKLNEHLFESIEMLKNNTDEKASPNERMDVDTAKAIADLGKIVIDGYKVKTQALHIMSKADNPVRTKEILVGSGIVGNDVKALGE